MVDIGRGHSGGGDHGSSRITVLAGWQAGGGCGSGGLAGGRWLCVFPVSGGTGERCGGFSGLHLRWSLDLKS